MKLSLILLCAGRGRRLKQDVDKAFVKIGHIPLFYYSYNIFKQIADICQIIIAARIKYFPFIRSYLKDNRIILVEGGRKRQDSVYRSILAVSKATDYILIHDADRPFISKRLVLNILKELKKHSAVICGLKCSDSLKLVKRSFVKNTLNRDDLYFIQTPQAFKKDLIVKAYSRYKRKELTLLEAKRHNHLSFCPSERGLARLKVGEVQKPELFLSGFTDDAQMLEAIGKPVKVVEGGSLNFKITYPQDLRLAKKLIKLF